MKISFGVTHRKPFLTVARLGIQEPVQKIWKAYFYSYLNADKNDNDIYEFAVLNRRDKLFVFLKKMNCHIWQWRAVNTDTRKPNFLHLAAKYVPSTEISGAALHMQGEFAMVYGGTTYFYLINKLVN